MEVQEKTYLERIIACDKEGKFDGVDKIPFGLAVAPWVGVARDLLKEKLGRRSRLISDAAHGELEKELLMRFSELTTPVFVLEMHIEKMLHPLSGTSGEARYTDYVKRFAWNSDYLKGIFDEYKVLGEWVVSATLLWINKVVEFYERIDADYDELEKRFGKGKPLGNVVGVHAGLSDPHNGNQSVYELKFESGISIFYKPKSLSIDAAFNEFVVEMSKRGMEPSQKGHLAWDRSSYGWVEKVEYLPCNNEQEVSDYYKRIGGLLCLFYLFGGTDLHHENLIASGAYPAVIDLESLFHPQLSYKQGLEDPEMWKQSVLRVGMLPNFMLGEIGMRGIDISALGGKGGQKAPTLGAKWDSLNTDEMRLIYVQPVTQAEKNVVRLGENEVEATDFVDEIVTGFKSTYQFLQQNRALLIGKGGWFERFAKAPVRCICRPTRLYFKLQQQLLDPARLRDKASHKEILDILPRYLLENGNDHLTPVVEEELRAMRQRDIPFFQTYPTSKDLYLNGKVIIKDVLAEPTIVASKRLIEKMDEEVLHDQVDLIVQSFYAVGYGQKERVKREKNESETSLIFSEELLIDEAKKIGEALVAKGRRDGNGGLRWLGIEFLPAEEQAILSPLSHNLYGGTLGIALFFGALYRVTRDDAWKEIAQASLQLLLKALDGDGVERMPGALGLGGFSGVGSIIYGLHCIATLIDEPLYTEKALFLASFIKEKHIQDDKQYDIIGGSAGLILSLLAVGDASLLPIAKMCGDYLKNEARAEAHGVSWGKSNKRGLLGFSHGVAGIAFALEKLAEATGDRSYLNVADAALTYERSHFSKEAQNWPDFRGDELSLGAIAWCHGATGIGLGRLLSPRYSAVSAMAEEVRIAVGTTKKGLSHSLHHLCCGDTGRIDFLREAADVLHDEELKAFVQEQLLKVIRQGNEGGGYCLNVSLPAGAFSPGFMQGLSGIGYDFLRFTESGKNLPNVLALS